MLLAVDLFIAACARSPIDLNQPDGMTLTHEHFDSIQYFLWRLRIAQQRSQVPDK